MVIKKKSCLILNHIVLTAVGLGVTFVCFASSPCDSIKVGPDSGISLTISACLEGGLGTPFVKADVNGDAADQPKCVLVSDPSRLAKRWIGGRSHNISREETLRVIKSSLQCDIVDVGNTDGSIYIMLTAGLPSLVLCSDQEQLVTDIAPIIIAELEEAKDFPKYYSIELTVDGAEAFRDLPPIDKLCRAIVVLRGEVVGVLDVVGPGKALQFVPVIDPDRLDKLVVKWRDANKAIHNNAGNEENPTNTDPNSR